jgi:hypothetical protein
MPSTGRMVTRRSYSSAERMIGELPASPMAA